MSYAISYDGRETESATTERVAVGGLRVASCLLALVRDEIAPGTGIDPAAFWAGLEAIVADLAPRNRALLARRDELQGRLDAWHRARAGRPWDPAAYRAFLEEIGYLEPEGGGFRITTENLDAEIAATAGPQLLVPVTNGPLRHRCHCRRRRDGRGRDLQLQAWCPGHHLCGRVSRLHRAARAGRPWRSARL